MKRTKINDELTFQWVDPRELKANEKNWRKHSRRQRQAYQALKKKVGWVGACLYNTRTDRLVDGHMRVDEAIKNGESVVPVLYRHLTEDQENLVLAQLDPIAALATTDDTALATLTKAVEEAYNQINDDHDRRLMQFNQDLQVLAESEETAPLIPQSKPIRKKQVKEDKQKPDEDDAVYVPPENNRDIVREIIEDDVRFPCSDSRLIPLPLQIPDLLPHMIATPDLLPRQTFNRSKNQDCSNPNTYYCISAVPYPDDRQGGCLGFFTTDYRFENVWMYSGEMASEFLEGDWSCLVSPDFSSYDSSPFPEKLWAIYRSRWCGRYWQEMGMYVVPAIQYMQVNSADMTIDISIETLPSNCPTIALQCRSLTDYDGLARIINHAIKRKKVEGVLLYGGETKKKYLHGLISKKAEVIYLPDFVSSRKKVRRSER